MAYSDFTLETVNRLLGVTARPANLFADLGPVEAPAWLTEVLTRGGQMSPVALGNEKARSEFIVAPMLLAARQVSDDRFAIYSGQRLDVDPGRGLVGECEFILAAREAVLSLQAPIAVIVEAKRHDIDAGIGQCVAQMVAADLFNKTDGGAGVPVFGCVTTGEAWQFLRLVDQEALVDRRHYYINDPAAILGVIRSIGMGEAT